MPENINPAAPSAPEPPVKQAPKVSQPAPDAGHVPMSEEMDSAKWTLPPIVPVVIALAAIAIVVAVVAFVNRPRPSAVGNITKVIAAEDSGNVLVAVHLKFDNATEGPLQISNISSELETTDGKKFKDGAAPAVDLERYLQASPELAEGKIEPLKEEMKIPPRKSQAGMVIFAYPVAKDDFDKRKSLTVRVDFYDRPAIVLKQ
jgi:hypothetical protein